MKERLEKLKQKTAIINLFRNCTEAELVDVKDMEDTEVLKIVHFLMKRETYTNKCLFSINDPDDISQWIVDRLKSINISNHLIINILHTDRWMTEIIVRDWKKTIELMLKNGGIIFFDYTTKIGIHVGFDEDTCFIDVNQL